MREQTLGSGRVTKRLVVEADVWSLFSGARIGVVVARSLDNTRYGDRCAALLSERAAAAAENLGDADLAAHPAVAPWREAYRQFGVKPSKHRSSIESLLRSARSGGVRSVNPLVDVYNAVSLGAHLPCGGEDLRMVAGDLRLVRAAGGESFVPLGSKEEQPPGPGEVIYRDDLGVVCRCWNWREADRTKLTEATTDAVLIIESVTGAEALEPACRELAQLTTELLGGTAAISLLDSAQPVCDLG